MDAARAAAPQAAHRPVVVAEAGPASDLVGSAGIAKDIPGDRWIWYIVLSDVGPLSGEGSIVVLDFFDGQVYDVVNVIG